jgi:hypothetical protein
MMLPALIAFFILLIVAALHFAWAMGSTFPAGDEASLSRMVTGFPDRPTMPGRGITLVVTLLLLVAGFWALLLADAAWLPVPGWLIALGGVALTLVFVARGVAGFTAGWRKATPVQPFAGLDRLYYSPLCLFLGLCFLILTSGYLR